MAAKHNSNGMCTVNVEINKVAKTMKRKDRDPHEAKTMSETIQSGIRGWVHGLYVDNDEGASTFASIVSHIDKP